MISLLALATSPVTQQTVAYPNYLVPSDAFFVAQAAQVPTRYGRVLTVADSYLEEYLVTKNLTIWTLLTSTL